MACAYSAIANKDGLLPQPHLVRRIVRNGGESEPPEVEIVHAGHRGPTPASNPVLRQTLIDGMRRVVEDYRGTAHKAGFRPEWKVAGKTGSAQWRTGRDTHAWFVGFAPWDSQYLILSTFRLAFCSSFSFIGS